jgi:hypothetical protein
MKSKEVVKRMKGGRREGEDIPQPDRSLFLFSPIDHFTRIQPRWGLDIISFQQQIHKFIPRSKRSEGKDESLKESRIYHQLSLFPSFIH